MSDYRTYVTQTGFGLERDAKFNNTHVDLAVLVVGDGVLPDSASPAERTDLLHQVREYGLTIEKDEKDPNVWIARAEIPASDGGFFIKEAGVKTKDKLLYAYARQAGDYKPLLEEGQGKSYTIRLKFVPGNADAIQIKIDPSVQFATPTDLSNAVKAHKNEFNPHPQYLKRERIISNEDIFSDRASGLYLGQRMTHAPQSSGEWFYISVNRYDAYNLFITATTMTRSTQVSFRASCVAGIWSNWIVGLTEYNTGSAVNYTVTTWSDDQNPGHLIKQGDRAFNTHRTQYDSNIDEISFSSPHILCGDGCSSDSELPFDLSGASIKSMITNDGALQLISKGGITVLREKRGELWGGFDTFITKNNAVKEIADEFVTLSSRTEYGSNIDEISFSSPYILCGDGCSSDSELPFDLSGASIKSMITSDGAMQLISKDGVTVLREKRGELWGGFDTFITKNNAVKEIADEFVTRSSIVGSVSDGAIIERGGNANGQFIKFSDGTMICRCSFIAENDDFYVSFPASFMRVPDISSNCVDSYNPRVTSITALTKDGFLSQAFSGSLDPNAPRVSYIAVGDWK